MPATIESLAKGLNISIATVSRALRNDRLIHSETRARVLAAAAEAGYERPARRGRPTTKTSYRFLVLIPPNGRAPTNITFHVYLKGLTAATGVAGCSLMVEEVSDDIYGKMNRRSKLPRGMKGGDRADAVFFIQRHDPQDVATIADIVPTVSLQWDYPEARADVVTSCNAKGMTAVTEYVIAQGHRKLLWVDEAYQASFFDERESGFIRACLRARIPLDGLHRIPHEAINIESIRNAMSKGVTAIFGANDSTARSVKKVCEDNGIRIPEDISLVGFDYDNREGTLEEKKQLCTYDACFVEIGKGSVQVALQRLKEPGASRIFQAREGWLHKGETVAKIA